MYEYTDGGKTGYTYKAKRTFVSGATKNGLKIAMCTLNCGNDFEFHKNMYGIRDYGLCLCEMLHDAQGYKAYTDQMELCVYIKDNEQQTGVRIPFERRELLPEEMIDDKTQVWYFAPIHFQDNCYGYEAFRFWSWENTANLFFRWNINIGNKIHDLLIEDKMNTLID